MPFWPPSWRRAGRGARIEETEKYPERLGTTPTHLCRLRYFGDEEGWGFAFYAYSNERYELSIFPTGEFFGPPEEACATAAGVYL